MLSPWPQKAPVGPDWGVYIHVPYCTNRCPYCDFYFTVRRPHAQFVTQVEAQWALTLPLVAGLGPAQTLYLGGGTPGLLSPGELERLVTAVARHGLVPNAEITLEVNPKNVTRAQAAAWKSLGITRVSLGLQSTNTTTLRALGRDHDGAQGLEALALVAEAGFHSFSVDLIFGSHGQTPATLDQDLATVAAVAPHVSVYCLTYEAGTNLDKRRARGKFTAATQEQEAVGYQQVQRALTAAGFEQYEVSNYARPGHHAVHNRLYWCGACTLGLGPGAASYLRYADGAATRFKNAPNLDDHLAGTFGVVDEEVLPPTRALADRMFAGLRDMRLGINLPQLENEHHAWVTSEVEDALLWEVHQGCLEEVAPRHFRLTAHGALWADRVARAVL